MLWLTVVIISVIFLLIFPIFSNVYLAFDKNRKALKAEISLFGLTVFKFNLIIKGLSVIIKQTFKSPYKIKLTPKFQKPKLMPKFSHISILSTDLVLNFGIGDEVFAPLYLISAINTAENELTKIINYNRPNLQVSNTINIFLNQNNFIAFLKIKVVFNLLDILSNLFHLFMEKIRYAN